MRESRRSVLRKGASALAATAGAVGVGSTSVAADDVDYDILIYTAEGVSRGLYTIDVPTNLEYSVTGTSDNEGEETFNIINRNGQEYVRLEGEVDESDDVERDQFECRGVDADPVIVDGTDVTVYVVDK